MQLEPGTTVLHYRIVDKIGEGGMGVVCRAVDTTLGREVAIKVLPDAFGADPQRLERFEREARLLASLNHPNIAAVHGLHSDGATRFIVMELVRGEDLAKRIDRGGLEQREALGFAQRIARALEAAHERGVVHRDLKPANVIVDDAGAVKVLDFGLAKMIEAPGGSASTSLSLSPTVTSANTQAGIILGTAAYMSPEQVRGREVDRRADMWAFGCLLYEMLAGRRPFGGETVSDALAAILKSEPDWSALPRQTPAAIRRLLRRCLAKDPANRQSGAADACILIEDVLAGRYEDEAPSVQRPSSTARALPWIVATIMTVTAALLAWLSLGVRPTTPTRDERRLSISLPNGSLLVYRLSGNTARSLALAPGGERLAYSGEGETDETVRLFVRDLDDFETRPLVGTDGASYPSFSPDGEWIVYARGTQRIEKIPAVGGASVPLAEVQSVRGVSWETPDRILYAPNLTGGIWSVDPAGGEPVQVTRPDETQKIISHRYPHMLPDGEHFLLTAKTSDLKSFDDALIMVASLRTGDTRTVLRGGMDARYLDGHLVYGRDGGLLAVPFDLEGLQTAGTPFPLVAGVITSPAWGCAQYDVLADGTIAYVPGIGADGLVELAWARPDGTWSLIGAPGNAYSFVGLVPDGRRALLGVQRANDDIWMLDVDRGSVVPFLSLDANEFAGVMSHGGNLLVYNSDRQGSYDLYLTVADSSDAPGEPLVIDDANKEPCEFSPDDSRVLYSRNDPDTGSDLWLVAVEGGRDPEPFLVTAANEGDGDFSPDGRWIAYSSDATGTYEVYLRPYPGPGPPIRISEAGGVGPRWAGDGRTLFYRSGSSLMAMPVEPEGSRVRTGQARTVLNLPGKVFVFDTHPDGRLLLAIAEGTAQRSREVRWFRVAPDGAGGRR